MAGGGAVVLAGCWVLAGGGAGVLVGCCVLAGGPLVAAVVSPNVCIATINAYKSNWSCLEVAGC